MADRSINLHRDIASWLRRQQEPDLPVRLLAHLEEIVATDGAASGEEPTDWSHTSFLSGANRCGVTWRVEAAGISVRSLHFYNEEGAETGSVGCRSDKKAPRHTLISYPGRKSRAFPLIAAALRREVARAGHQLQDIEFREPFLGSGSVSLELLSHHPEIKRVWINDLDTGIACLWTAVRRYPAALAKKVESYSPDDQSIREFRRDLETRSGMPEDGESIVEIGFRKLAVHQLSFSGMGLKAGEPRQGWKNLPPDTLSKRWNPRRSSVKIQAFHELLASVSLKDDGCTNLGYETVLRDQTCPNVTYLDPPYFYMGKYHYQVAFTEEDHRSLRFLLQNTKDPWVLSYDDHPAIRDLYSWASIENIPIRKITAKSPGSNPTRPPPHEVLIFQNRDS